MAIGVKNADLLLLTLYHRISTFKNQEKKAFENIVGKGENAGNQHFLLFHNVFYAVKERSHNVSSIWFVVCKYFEFGLVKKFVVW